MKFRAKWSLLDAIVCCCYIVVVRCICSVSSSEFPERECCDTVYSSPPNSEPVQPTSITHILPSSITTNHTGMPMRSRPPFAECVRVQQCFLISFRCLTETHSPCTALVHPHIPPTATACRSVGRPPHQTIFRFSFIHAVTYLPMTLYVVQVDQRRKLQF